MSTTECTYIAGNIKGFKNVSERELISLLCRPGRLKCQ